MTGGEGLRLDDSLGLSPEVVTTLAKGEPVEEVNTKPSGSKKKPIFILAGVGLLAVLGGFLYWQYAQTHISTDDAYVTGSIYSVSLRIPGTVARFWFMTINWLNRGRRW